MSSRTQAGGQRPSASVEGVSVEEALLVVLDHAEHRGELSQGLQQRVANLLQEMQIVGPWTHLDPFGGTRFQVVPNDLTLYKVGLGKVFSDGIAGVSSQPGMFGTGPYVASCRPDRVTPWVTGRFECFDEGKSWVDKTLSDWGWALVPGRIGEHPDP